MVDEAYFYATEVVGLHFIGKEPPPRGLHTVLAGDWELHLNTSNEVKWVEDLAPVMPDMLFARNLRHLAFAKLTPFAGAIAGMSGDDFIDEMQRLAEQVDVPA